MAIAVGDKDAITTRELADALRELSVVWDTDLLAARLVGEAKRQRAASMRVMTGDWSVWPWPLKPVERENPYANPRSWYGVYLADPEADDGETIVRGYN